MIYELRSLVASMVRWIAWFIELIVGAWLLLALGG